MKSITVNAPASKSLSHRALIGAALAGGVSRLSGVLESEDTERTMGVLASCGAVFERTGAGAYTVTGLGGAPVGAVACDAPLSCFAGESGTTCRLLTAVLAAGRGRFRVHGSGRLHERPIGELVDALRSLGAGIRYEGKEGCPPLVLEARGLSSDAIPDGIVRVGCGESSQYLSGLLLAAPLSGGLTVLLDGDKAVSWPYVGLTLDALETFGAPFRVEVLQDGAWAETDWRRMEKALPGVTRFVVAGAAYRARELRVEGDWSGASYFLAAGAIGPNPVTVRGLRRDSLQGDSAMLGFVERMGAKVSWSGDEVTVAPSVLRGIEADLSGCPDLAPTLAVLAAFAEGVTLLKGAAHLRAKESDRLAAPARELRKTGCAVEVTDDGLMLAGPREAPRGELALSCHNDHRMAMSLALLGLCRGLTPRLDDPACVAKSFPGFWREWEKVAGAAR